MRLNRSAGEATLQNLCATNPEKYKPAAQIGNLSSLPTNAGITWPAGSFLSNGAPSPEMPDAAWQIYIDYAISQIQKSIGTLPATTVSNIENWTEYGISVPSSVKWYAQTDPAILTAKGLRSWVDYVSMRKGYYEKKMRDALKAKYPNALYTAYGYGGLEKDKDTLWTWDYKYLKDGTDYPANESYYNYFNTGFALNYDMFTDMTHARYDEISNGSPHFYHWLCAGYIRNISTYQGATSQGMYADLQKWMGFLKISYVAGMLGGITTGEFDCNVNYDDTFAITTPPKWLDQIAILGQAHALFSWLEPVLRNSDLLEGPYMHKWSSTHPAYEFTQNNTKVMARKTKNQNQWLICAWAMDGVEGNVTVNIPDLGDYTINARTCGTVYLVEKNGTTVSSQWYDENGMYPSLSASQINGSYIQALSISINPEYVPLAIGESKQLTVQYNPSNTTNQSVMWNSSNPAIATVSSTGLVRRIAAGSADIYATDQEMGHQAVFKLTIPITGISLDITSKTLAGATTQQLNATLLPTTATIKTVTWSSSNPNVATVSATGLVTTVGAGTAVITATADDYSHLKADCNITVTYVSISGISFTNKFIKVGSSLGIVPAFTPANSSNTNLIWGASSDVNVMKVAPGNRNGLVVTGVSVGKASVIATTEDGGKTATCPVYITAPLTGSNFFSSTNSGTSNNVNGYLGYQFTPTSDFSIYALGRYSNAQMTNTHTIKLWKVADQSLVCSVILTTTSPFEVLGYQYEKLPTAILLKAGTAYRIVSEEKVGGDTWKSLGAISSHSALATIDYGVSGTSVFPATIAAGAVANNGYGAPTFLISPMATSVSVTKPYKNIEVGKTTQLVATTTPIDANRSGNWSSSNNSVATVNSNGLVTGVSEGTAKIYFSTLVDPQMDSSIIYVYNNFKEKRYYLVYGADRNSNLPQSTGTQIIDYRPNGENYGARSNAKAPMTLEATPDPSKGLNGQTNYFDYTVSPSATPAAMNWYFGYYSTDASVPALDFTEIDSDWKLHISFRTNINSNIMLYIKGKGTDVMDTLKLGTFKNDNKSWNTLDINMKYFMDQKGWTYTGNNSTLGYFACLTGAVNYNILGLKTLDSINNYELAVDDIYFSVLADSSNTSAIHDVHQDAQIRILGNSIMLKEGEGIQLYSVTGMLVGKTDGNTMNTGNLITGVYMVKTPYGVTKFVKR